VLLAAGSLENTICMSSLILSNIQSPLVLTKKLS
jgi:hypothetical protein